MSYQADGGWYPGEPRTPFTGKIFVLLDRNSISAAETSARLASYSFSGNSALIGERSVGAVDFWPISDLVLRKTKLRWPIPTGRSYDPYGRNEGIGLPVDIYLEPGMSTEQIIRKLPELERYMKQHPKEQLKASPN